MRIMNVDNSKIIPNKMSISKIRKDRKPKTRMVHVLEREDELNKIFATLEVDGDPSTFIAPNIKSWNTHFNRLFHEYGYSGVREYYKKRITGNEWKIWRKV